MDANEIARLCKSLSIKELRATSPPGGAVQKARKESLHWTNQDKLPTKPGSSQSSQRSKSASDKEEVYKGSQVPPMTNLDVVSSNVLNSKKRWKRLARREKIVYGTMVATLNLGKRMVFDAAVSESNGSKGKSFNMV
ncbi:hypothetical protein ACOSQ2_027641 [Xanthoceras sorbifolium]